MNRREARARARALVSLMTPEERAEQLKSDAPAIERLGVPARSRREESIQGTAGGAMATVFPQAIGLGAAFDTELMGSLGRAISTEARARYNARRKKGGSSGLTFRPPNVDIFYDPRWGGGRETFGEDPYLTSRLAAELVRGLQGDGRVMRTAVSAVDPDALRTSEWKSVSKKDMTETYLPALEALSREAKAEDVRGALSRGRGKNGKDTACEKNITEAAIRLFTNEHLLGMYGACEYDTIPFTAVHCPEHLDLARRAAVESTVMLKNTGLLPLDRERIHTLGVIGPNADSREALTGGRHGSAYRYITVLEGLQDYLYGCGIRILSSRGCRHYGDSEDTASAEEMLAEAAAVAEESDAVVLVLGLDGTPEGEAGNSGGSDSLLLPESQRELMEAVAKTGKPTVLMVMAGGGVDLSFAGDNFDAILMLWHPGEQGGRAAAQILFGDETPSGKLPVTFYEGISGLPGIEDYSMEGRTYRYLKGAARYPFGYGLTYEDTVVRNAKVRGSPDTGFIVAAEIGNRGPRDTEEVIEVYIRCADLPFAPRNPSLCAFRREYLRVWEHRSIEIPVPAEAFTVVNDRGERVLGRVFDLYVGVSQPDEKSIALTGKRPESVRIEL